MDRTGFAGRSRPKIQRDFARSRLAEQFVSSAYELLIPIRREVVQTQAKRLGDGAWPPAERELGQTKKIGA